MDTGRGRCHVGAPPGKQKEANVTTGVWSNIRRGIKLSFGFMLAGSALWSMGRAGLEPWGVDAILTAPLAPVTTAYSGALRDLPAPGTMIGPGQTLFSMVLPMDEGGAGAAERVPALAILPGAAPQRPGFVVTEVHTAADVVEVWAARAGRVWDLVSDNGMVPQRGEPVLHMLDCARMTVVANVPRQGTEHFTFGTPVRFEPEGGGAARTGSVTRINGNAAAGSGRLAITLAPGQDTVMQVEAELDPVSNPGADPGAGCTVGGHGRLIPMAAPAQAPDSEPSPAGGQMAGGGKGNEPARTAPLDLALLN